MSAISFLAGMGAGYITGKDKAEEQKRRDARDKREQDAFDMKKTEFDQSQADKAALKETAAPMTVTPEQGPPTEEQHIQAKLKDRQPDAIGYRVGNGPNAKMFAAQGVADEAAKPMNTPEARRTRMADLAAQGNTFAATALTGDMQREAAQLAIDKSKQEVADRALKKRIDGFKSPEDIAAFMTETPADNMGGNFKAQARYSPDKKTFTFDQVNADGTLTSTEHVFENTPKGMEKAKMTLAGYLTPEQRLQHYQFEETKAEQARHNKATEDVAKQNANTNEQYRKDQAAHMRETTARLSANAKAADAPPTWSKDADEQIVKLNSFKNPDTGRDEIDGNGAQFMQTVALDSARKNGGNTLAAIARAAELDAALKVKAKGDPGMLAQLRSDALAAASARPATQQAAPTNNAPAGTAVKQRTVVNPSAIAARGFNEVGYSDVQSTIDGAQRGDKNALAFLGVLINRGETTPGQRQQIANLLK